MFQNSQEIKHPDKHIQKCSQETEKSDDSKLQLSKLSINTRLPHISYEELKAATNNFEEKFIFENGRFLGSGSAGEVYLALGLFGKSIAVKKFYGELKDCIDNETAKKFLNEIEVFSKYKHANLLPLLGYSCDGAAFCLLYDYIPGGTLKNRLTINGELIWTTRLYIAMEVAEVVAYLHTAFTISMIHRDVKTDNILLDSNNKPILIDFSLSTLAPDPNSNKIFSIEGSLGYMAPEVQECDVSIKVDTFSFGTVLLELLTSRPAVEVLDYEIIYLNEKAADDDILQLLDVSVGEWIHKDVNYANILFGIAQECLLLKEERPTMLQVSEKLTELVQKFRSDSN